MKLPAPVQFAIQKPQELYLKVQRKPAFVVIKDTTLWLLIAVIAFTAYAVVQDLFGGLDFWVFVICFAAVLTTLEYLVLRQGTQGLERARTAGWWILLAIAVLAGWSSWLRIPPEPLFWGLNRPTVFLICYAFLIALALWILRRDGRDRMRIRLRTAILMVPLVSAWLVSSLVHFSLGLAGTQPYFKERTTLQLQASRNVVFDERTGRAGEYQGAVVAVALSGGGYRAASIHAGVLRALDDLQVPVHYLTTVSGGSIVGAFYALGFRPENFQTLLISRHPGLPNDLFALFNFGREWLAPRYRNSDTYAEHFSRTYFEDFTLQDTGKDSNIPIPIINVTEFSSARRWSLAPSVNGYSIQCDGHGQSHVCDSISIAEAVAASGAFPGAFEPKKLAALDDHEFTDGGVAENLGLAGLREYFFHLPPEVPRPNVVIVSDASKERKDRPAPWKWFILSMLTRAAVSGSEAYHRQLYADFTDDEYEHWLETLRNPSRDHPVTQPFTTDQRRAFGFHSGTERGEETVYTIILDPTNAEELEDLVKKLKERTYDDSYTISNQQGRPSRFTMTEETIRGVREIPTLQELRSDQVAAGGWLGQHIVQKYQRELLEVLEFLSSP